MSPGLRLVSDDAPPPCHLCGRPAAGPCARCRALVCADCCTLTTETAKVWAICLVCERQGGGTLRPQWVSLATWLGAILLLLGLAVVVVGALAGR